MTVTVLGAFLIPIGVFFFLVRPRYLLSCTILFSGFSGSAVFLVGDLGIQPSYWFALLWIINKIINGVRISEVKKCFRENIFLCAFVLYSTLSIMFPLILESDIIIMNVDGKITSLTFTMSCITQLIYLWFCYILFLSFSVHFNKNKNRIDDFIDCYLRGAALVCAVCFYQILCFKTGMPFDEIFRQNLHGNVQGARIYGPCIEASMLCYYLVTVLPLSIRRKNWWSFLQLIVTIGLGVYSFSSTFIAGLGIWGIFEIINDLRKRTNGASYKKIIMILVGCVLGVITIFVFRDHVGYALEKLSVTLKQENTSGIQRGYSFRLLIDAFKKSPIFGIGFGTCRGNDLFSTWLAEVGIIGACFLAIYLFEKVFWTKSDWNLKVANILVWSVMLISVPEPYNLFVWLLLSLLNVGPKCIRRKAEV